MFVDYRSNAHSCWVGIFHSPTGAGFASNVNGYQRLYRIWIKAKLFFSIINIKQSLFVLSGALFLPESSPSVFFRLTKTERRFVFDRDVIYDSKTQLTVLVFQVYFTALSSLPCILSLNKYLGTASRYLSTDVQCTCWKFCYIIKVGI